VNDQARDGLPDFPVVALGASAGGLEALSEFLDHLKGPHPCAVVVLMHLDADRKSSLVELLSAHTDLVVSEVEDGIALEKGKVYVLPPGQSLTLAGDRFRLAPRKRIGEHVIDTFFRSLAEQMQARAVGVVLSGTGSDGALGLREVRAGGGITMAQDPEEARFSGMPDSAVRRGPVDFVMPVARLAESLAGGLAERLAGQSTKREPDPVAGDLSDSGHAGIVAILKDRKGHDFSGYKAATLGRRIARRVLLANVPDQEAYARLLLEDADEVDHLFRDILIGVTRFFRDPDAFARLRELAFDAILGESDGEGLRIWVPGCASGEEAYSLAILLAEWMESKGLRIRVQIFATDLDTESIEVGRRGRYPGNVEEDVSPERLRRFFEKEDGTYRVTKEVREMLIFSVHDVIHDPPFCRLDLVSCRNLLIYLDEVTQERVLSNFFYGLKPSGYLFLGSVESATQSPQLFDLVEKGCRVFRRRPGTLPAGYRFWSRNATGLGRRQGRLRGMGGHADLPELRVLSDRFLAKLYGPPSVIVTAEGHVVQFLGDTSAYVEHPEGAPDLNISRIVRKELRAETGRTLRRLREGEAGPIRSNRVAITTARGPESVVVAGHRMAESLKEGQGFWHLGFESVEGSRADVPDVVATSLDDPDAVHRLRELLEQAKAELRVATEDLASSSQEFQAANQELTSMNEELQATNEELESSQEELHSLNEELETVNAELRANIEELSRVNSNLHNLMASTDIATIFVDRRLGIREFTPAATRIFKLRPTDVGRQLSDISSVLLGEGGLESEAREVLRTLTPLEHPISARDGRIFNLSLLPYLTVAGVIDGVVLTFTDLTDLRRAESEAEKLAQVLRFAQDAILIVDQQGRIKEWNRGAARTYGYTREEALAMDVVALVPEALREDLRSRLERTRTGEDPKDFETTRVTKDGQAIQVSTTFTALPGEHRGSRLVAMIERDISERVRSDAHRKLLVRELDHRVKNTFTAVQAIIEQTIARSGRSAHEFGEAVRGRLDAMARVHRKLSSKVWTGVDLEELLEGALKPFASAGSVVLEGEAVALPPPVSLPLAMSIHELATNAAKYGALSVPGGGVRVRWRVGPDRTLELEWTEEGGPAAVEPEELGFGLEFLQRAMSYEVGGSTDIVFAHEGLRCTFRIPLPD
jgi:two-component system CheB/CheR fusion protein